MIKIITGKGGVGKTSAGVLYSLTQALNGQTVHYVSIDVLNTPADALGIQREYDTDPLMNEKWQSVWSYQPWKTYKKTLKEKTELGDLLLKTVNPTGKKLPGIRNALIKGLYSEYELNAGSEILKNHDNLVIDTDSLEGLQRLLNYASENTQIKNKLIQQAEIIPVTILEKSSLNKLNNIYNQPLIKQYSTKPSTIIINHARKNDERLTKLNNDIDLFNNLIYPELASQLGIDYVSNIAKAKQVILYEQQNEPTGLNLLKLNQPQDLTIKYQEIKIKTQKIPKHTIIMPLGKGGQGKTTISCALALKLAEEGKPVYLMSADARSSLSDILNEPIGELSENEPLKYLEETQQYKGLPIYVLKENPYWDNVPGTPLMKAMIRTIKHYETGMNLIIDMPPTGNFMKSMKLGITQASKFQEILYNIDLMQLRIRKKQGVIDYYNTKKRAYEQGINIMHTSEVYALPVMQPTQTALNETLNLINQLEEYGINPYYQPLMKETNELGMALTLAGKIPVISELILLDKILKYKREAGKIITQSINHARTHTIEDNNYRQVIINKASQDKAEFINELRYKFPENDYKLTLINETDNEPTGRTELSKIARQLL